MDLISSIPINIRMFWDIFQFVSTLQPISPICWSFMLESTQVADDG